MLDSEHNRMHNSSGTLMGASVALSVVAHGLLAWAFWPGVAPLAVSTTVESAGAPVSLDLLSFQSPPPRSEPPDYDRILSSVEGSWQLTEPAPEPEVAPEPVPEPDTETPVETEPEPADRPASEPEAAAEPEQEVATAQPVPDYLRRERQTEQADDPVPDAWEQAAVSPSVRDALQSGHLAQRLSDWSVRSYALPGDIGEPSPGVSEGEALSEEVRPQYQALIRAALQANHVYPRRAQRLNQEGVVTLSFEVRSDGDVQALVLRESSGHSSLDDAALHLVRSLSDLPPFPDELTAHGVEALRFEVPIQYELR